ncbi:hypothetical protein VTO73DRAFT_14454 [Trametes versicolor]
MSTDSNSSTSSTVPLATALATLSDIQTGINDLVLEMDQTVRETLVPLGFTFNPTEWRSSAKRVLNEVNQEYRLIARVDILLGSRRITRQKGLKHVLERILAGKHAGARITSLLSELQEIQTNHQDKLSLPDRIYIASHLASFEKGLKLVTDGTDGSAARFEEHRAYLQVLDQPMWEVKEAISDLYRKTPLRVSTATAKATLALLADFYDTRSELSAKARSLATTTYHILCANAYTVPRPSLDESLRELRGIHERLEEQRASQLAIVEEFRTCSQVAASTPEVLSGTELSVSRLRTSYEEFKQIVSDMSAIQEVYEPLEAAVGIVLERIRHRVAYYPAGSI